MKTELWAVGLVFLASIVAALGPIFLKRGSKKFRLNIRALLKNYSLIAGVALYGISTVLFVPALKGGDLSVLYPLVSLTYVWVSFLSIRMLNEKMNALKWIGILLIIIGVSFIGFGG